VVRPGLGGKGDRFGGEARTHRPRHISARAGEGVVAGVGGFALGPILR
jgi:hypothetical protein